MTDDSISDEDKALFREHMGSVKPLNEKTRRVKKEPPQPVIPPKTIIKPGPNLSLKKEYHLSDYINETVLSDTVLSYCHPSVQKKHFKLLKQGHIPFEGKLDLHGLKTEPARDALCCFITTQKQKNARCLLIIHGKGGHEGAPPVIKNLINRWLPQLDEVLAFHSALARDGGCGAVYVLLTRH